MTREYFGFQMSFTIDNDQKLTILCPDDQAWTKLEELEKLCDKIEVQLYFSDDDGHFQLKRMRQIAKITRAYLSKEKHHDSSSSSENVNGVQSLSCSTLENNIIELNKKLLTESELVSRFSNKNIVLSNDITTLQSQVKILQDENAKLQSNENLANSKLLQLKELATSWEGKYDQSVIKIQSLTNQLTDKMDLINTLDKRLENNLNVLKNEMLEKACALDNAKHFEKKIKDVQIDNDYWKSKFSELKRTLENSELEQFKSKISELENDLENKSKLFHEEKRVFVTKISDLEKSLAQHNKDFDDAKIVFSTKIDKYETCFLTLEKQNALLESKLASHVTIISSSQKEYSDLRVSYNVLKDKFDSLKNSKRDSQVHEGLNSKTNVPKRIYTGNSSKPLSKRISQFTNYSLQKNKKYSKSSNSNGTFTTPNFSSSSNSKQVLTSKQSIPKHMPKTKPFTYSIPELLNYAPKQFTYSVQKVNAFETILTQHRIPTKSFHSSKKQLFPNAPQSFSNSVHSKNDFVPKTPPLTHPKWIPNSPTKPETSTPTSTTSNKCFPEKWNSYSLHIINTTYQYFANHKGPKFKWVPKVV